MTDAAATLVVGPSWVGDMVMAQALFRLLQQQDPDCPIDVLAPAWSLPIVARMPEVRCGISAETGHGEFGLGKRRRIGVSLRGRYSRAIVLPRSLKAALIPWFAKVPVRTGFRGESRYFFINDMRRLDRTVLDQTVKRYVSLGREVRQRASEDDFWAVSASLYPQLQVAATNQQRIIERLQLDRERPAIGLMPGAEYGPAKCWPLEHFKRLAERLSQSGFVVWVLGGEKDIAAGDAIAADGHAENLCGRTSLEDVIDLLSLCEQVVTNDSGLMHVAAAVGCHVHAIYGSSSPGFTPPLTAAADIHYLDLDCSPCFERRCPLTHLNCLTHIDPASIYDKIVAKSA